MDINPREGNWLDCIKLIGFVLLLGWIMFFGYSYVFMAAYDIFAR
jgi:hypothetical protein